MFEGWGEFYLMAGSSAAVLIGLIFVVVTLMHDQPRSTVLAGARLYMGPVVLQVSFVLVLSAAALARGVTPGAMELIAAVVAVWGLARAVRSVVGIRSREAGIEEAPHWTDQWFYGIIPGGLYALLGALAWAFWAGREWAPQAMAAVITAMLLNAIRNEWDLVTWLAPRPDKAEGEQGE
jgi:hypothetical protein